MACAKLIEILGGFNFGIDAWFVRNPESFGAVPTGRMAPMTALNFVFIATGLFALTGKQPAKFAGPLGALATVIGAVVLVGYWYGTPLLYAIGEKAAGIFICDVMGHGVRSALITSMIRELVEEHGQAAADPGELLTRVNRALAVILKQADTTMFATCFYVVADVECAQLRFANAGHPSALHIQHGNGAAQSLQGHGRPGPAMGIFPTASYVTSSSPMKKGDRVMLFTDGLFEVEDASGTVFTEEQLHTTVARYAALPAQEFFDRVINDVRQFSERKSFDDDVCVVGMEVQYTG
jgi:serine phosphatase RsbU (regulator of sigma subunit)